MQLGNKLWTAKSSAVMAGDYQAKIPGKLGLFYETKSLGGIAHPPHIKELTFEERFPQQRVEGIVFN
jgi:hypothetical protein